METQTSSLRQTIDNIKPGDRVYLRADGKPTIFVTCTDEGGVVFTQVGGYQLNQRQVANILGSGGYTVAPNYTDMCQQYVDTTDMRSIGNFGDRPRRHSDGFGEA